MTKSFLLSAVLGSCLAIPSAASADALDPAALAFTEAASKATPIYTLPYAQARLLSMIEDQGAARISDLAALDHCSQPTMTTQVRRLESAGLVSRIADPADARAVLISITEQGVAALADVRTDRSAVIDPYLERLDDADRRTLADAVRVMRSLLDDAQLEH